jgi:ribosome assembly protein 1
MTEKIVTSLGIKIPARDLKYSDSKAPLQSLFNLWIPLARSLLNMVVEYLPSPQNLAEEKVVNLICAKTRQFKTLPIETQKLRDGLY